VAHGSAEAPQRSGVATTDALDALASGGAAILGRPLSEGELDSFGKYLKLLQKWQKSQRLIGSDDPGWIVENLLLDSLLFLKLLPRHMASLADVGSGAGVPGIPMKLVRPSIRLVLIESRAKRVSFLSAVVRELGLHHVDLVAQRVEEYAVQRPRSCDAAVMRCAGGFSSLARAAAPLVVAGGLVVASGPPVRRPLDVGAWVEVPGVRSGTVRQFAVLQA
jgi:16S rRNA (guanine527-N7)-methyltransferase